VVLEDQHHLVVPVDLVDLEDLEDQLVQEHLKLHLDPVVPVDLVDQIHLVDPVVQ
jgi:hypothetical protein